MSTITLHMRDDFRARRARLKRVFSARGDPLRHRCRCREAGAWISKGGTRGLRLIVDHIESVQIALFLRAPPPGALQLWNEAIKNAPVMAFQTHAPGHTEAKGAVGEISVSINSQTAVPRIDLVFQPLDLIDQPFLSDVSSTLSAALELSAELVPAVSVGRTAVVMQGYKLATDALDACKKVGEMLPMVPVPENSRDITYALNVAGRSKIQPERTLVRLCRWQSVQFQVLSLSPLPTQKATPPPRFAAHLYVDVFGDETEPLTADAALASLKEVIAEAMLIMENGYDAFA